MSLLLPANVKHIHFIGIGGYGMSALAMILLQLGYRVSGSDIKESRLTERLLSKGADIKFQHHPRNLDGCHLAIYSTAIPEDNSEILEARRQSMPLWHRSELLAEMINSHYGIAVAGTHGKTTTTAMLSLLLEEGGLDPTAVIGGELNLFEGNARLGKGRCLVAEACESDNSFLRYHPRMMLVTNIEADHLENFNGDYEKLKEAYDLFISRIHPEGCLVLCGEDSLLWEKSLKLSGKVRTYGLEDYLSVHPNVQFDFTARDVCFKGMSSQFAVYSHEGHMVDVNLSVPGRHNVSNAVGAIAAAAELGVRLSESVKALEKFTGAGRRFEVLGEAAGITVVDDYAHHPTEIKATLQAASGCGSRRVFCIFQPHRYTRTGYFMAEYADSFGAADELFLHSIYAAGESPIEGVSAEALAHMIEEKHERSVYYGEKFAELVAAVLKKASPGDMIITMGAGDIWKVGRHILEELSLGKKNST